MDTNFAKFSVVIGAISAVVGLLAWLYPVNTASYRIDKPSVGGVHISGINNSTIVTGGGNATSTVTNTVTNTNASTINSNVLSSFNEEYTAPQFAKQTTNRKKNTNPETTSVYRKAYLKISGTSVSVLIKESKHGVAYDGGRISSTSTTNTVYLPKGQRLSVLVTGTSVDIEIEREIAEFVSVSDSGVGTDVSEI